MDIRKLFQEFVSKNKHVQIKISFFPVKFSRFLVMSSNYKSFNSIYKSGTFQRSVTFTTNDYEYNNNIIQNFITSFNNYVKTQGKDVSFIPYYISNYSFSGSTNLYRIQYYNKLIKQDFNKNNIVAYPYTAVRKYMNTFNLITKKMPMDYMNMYMHSIFNIMYSLNHIAKKI